MSRSRSRGVLITGLTQRPTYTQLQARRVWNGSKYVVETREYSPVANAVTYKSDDREAMTDEVDQFGKYNQIDHTKNVNMFHHQVLAKYKPGVPTSAQLAPFGTSWATYGYDLGGISFSDLGWTTFSAFALPYVALPTVDWSGLVAQVGSSLDGSMKSSTNMLVNIAQIAQVIRMFKNPMLLRSLVKAGHLGVPISQVPKTVSSLWLEYRYGWRNLYMDVRALARVQSEVASHVRYLQETSNSFIPRSASQVDEGTSTLQSPITVGSVPGSVKVSSSTLVRERTCVFSLRQKNDAFVRRFTKGDLIQQRLGTNQLLEALWDLVPWSFCMDWFIHIDRFLKQNPVFWSMYTLDKMGYSIKDEYSMRVKFDSYAETSFLYDHPGRRIVYSDPVHIASSYTRTRGFPPDTSGSGIFSSLRLTNLADAAALIVQRL